MTISLEKNDIHSTLTTWLYCCMSQAYACEQLGFKYHFNWPRFASVQSYDDAQMFSQVPNMYGWYFVQPCGEPESIDQTWMWETHNWGTNPDYQRFAFMSQPLSVIRDFYKRTLIFNDAVNARGNELVSKYNIDFKKTIGITWRGTDIYLESLNGNLGRPRMSIETYFPFIDELLAKEPDLRIMCTAEEESILDPLLSRYPNAFKVEEFIQAPHGSQHNPERHSKTSGFERGLQPVLMVWLFSMCAHYIKNRASTAAVASWLSDGRIISLGHPENLGFYDKGNPYKEVAEIEGKEYPLYK